MYPYLYCCCLLLSVAVAVAVAIYDDDDDDACLRGIFVPLSCWDSCPKINKYMT